jgi:hypothetical protein
LLLRGHYGGEGSEVRVQEGEGKSKVKREKGKIQGKRQKMEPFLP